MPDSRTCPDTYFALLTDPPPWLRLAAIALLAALAVNLFYQGAQPYAVGLIPSPWDKLAHLMLFGGLAALAWVALGARGAGAHLGAIAIAVAVGLLDEAAQSLLPGRSVDVVDIVADIGGAVFIVLLLVALRTRRPSSA